jgi:glycerol-3-phosphate cytidylyltransferase-like family protein
MSPKAKSKGRLAATKLKSRRTGKGKSRSKRVVSTRKETIKTRNKKTAIAKARKRSAIAPSNKIVRIMGHGQFTVDGRTLKKLNDTDNAIVELVSTERSDDTEFKKKLTELSNLVVENGKPLDPHEIIRSDIILPSVDLSIDEAKKLFRGEGVIPEI